MPHRLFRAAQLSHRYALVFAIAFYSQAIAQTDERSFGRVREVELPDRFDGFMSIRDDGTGSMLLFWRLHSTEYYLIRFDSLGAVQSASNVYGPHCAGKPFIYRRSESDTIYVSQFDSTGKSLLFSILDSTQIKPVNKLRLVQMCDGALVADADNNGITDVFLYGAESSGILVTRPSRGLPVETRRIAADLAPKQVLAMHLNSDRLLDLIVYDWVRSELHLLYGIGRGEFLDQTVFPVRSEILWMKAERRKALGQIWLWLLMKSPLRLELWEGDAVGDFSLRFSLALADQPLLVNTGDVNGDGDEEILLLHKSSRLQIIYNVADAEAMKRQNLSIGGDASYLELLSAGRQLPGLVALDNQSRQLRIFGNARDGVATQDSLLFAAGLRPSSVVFQKTSDAEGVITVLNTGTGSVSQYPVIGNLIYGPVDIAAIPSASVLMSFAAPDSIAQFTIASWKNKTVSLISHFQARDSISVTSVPTEGEAEPMFTRLLHSGLTEFGVYNYATTLRPASVSLFRQLAPETFIEKSFRISAPNELIGAAVRVGPTDSLKALAYAVRSHTTGGVQLLVSLSAERDEFIRRSLATEIADTTILRCTVIFTDADNDGIQDLLVNTVGDTTALIMLKGLNDTSFTAPALLGKNFKIASPRQLIVGDFDGDGIPDIAANEMESSSVGWFKGKGGGEFYPFQPLVSRQFMSHCAVGDLNGDGFAELLILFADIGQLGIYDGKRLLAGKGSPLSEHSLINTVGP